MAEAEDVIREAGRIGVMLLDADVRFVVKKSVQDVGGVPGGGVNDSGVKWSISIRNKGVNERRRVRPVLQVDRTDRLPAPSDLKPLSIG